VFERSDRSSSLCVVTYSAPLPKRLDLRFASKLAQAPSVEAMPSTKITVETIYCQKCPGIDGKVRLHIVVVNNRADMTLGRVGGGRPVTNDDERYRLKQKWRERRVRTSICLRVWAERLFTFGKTQICSNINRLFYNALRHLQITTETYSCKRLHLNERLFRI
jgi:hypothetical protein